MQAATATPTKTANFFNFIPRLPSKEAWNARLFHGFGNLRDLVETLKAIIKGPNPSLRFYLRGQIIFRRRHPEFDMNDFHEFSGVAELAMELEKLNWSPDTIKEIYFYDHGYLRVEA
jgi:hypothetical protein